MTMDVITKKTQVQAKAQTQEQAQPQAVKGKNLHCISMPISTAISQNNIRMSIYNIHSYQTKI